MAYQFARRAVELAPKNSYGWSNLGMMEDQLYRFERAEDCFKAALACARDEDQRGAAYLNWACMLVNKGDWDRAEQTARTALEYRPQSAKAQANLGLALLAKGRWKEGWPLYDAVIGFDKSRRKVQYANEPVWDGAPGKRIVIYGEQGIGDEVGFASMIPDALAISKSVVIDCDARLEHLFRRSFPSATVYGTRWDQKLGWDRTHVEVDASISIGGLGKLFRNSDESFPGTPYLQADPDRVEMWLALKALKGGRPMIGIAWSGGVPWTADRYRRWTLDELLPVFQAQPDAIWISLEYKDAAQEIAAFKQKHPEVDLRQYRSGTLTDDYDDTAALVAAVDFVFSMQTAVIHLAGALGKPCWCFVNKTSHWRYARGERLVWYDSVRLWRQGKDGVWPLEAAARELRERTWC